MNWFWGRWWCEGRGVFHLRISSGTRCSTCQRIIDLSIIYFISYLFSAITLLTFLYWVAKSTTQPLYLLLPSPSVHTKNDPVHPEAFSAHTVVIILLYICETKLDGQMFGHLVGAHMSRRHNDLLIGSDYSFAWGLFSNPSCVYWYLNLMMVRPLLSYFVKCRCPQRSPR